MIELKNVSKRYERIVLDNINLTLEENKVYLIKGISGCGKTTLLNIIGNIDKNYTGEYLYNKKKISKTNNPKIGYGFQQSLLISHLTVYENLAIIRNDSKMINELSNIFGITKLLQKMPQEISLGERQRVSLVRTLLINPKLIILDEPTASLDEKNAKEVARYVNNLCSSDRIIIIATHSNIFDEIADEIINLDYGKIQSIKKNNIKRLNNKIIEPSKINRQYKIDIKYGIKKYLKSSNKISILIISFVFLLIFACISLKINFQKQYILYLGHKYPFKTISLTKENYESLIQNYSFESYENYYLIDKGIEYYILLPKDETIISKKKYIKIGEFPKNDSEVLVNSIYFDEYLKKEDIGKRYIDINNYKLKIVGVLNDETYYLEDIYESNKYYEKNNKAQVFVPYYEMKEISNNKIKESEYVLSTIYNLYENDNLLQQVKYSGDYYWDKKISSISYTLDEFLNVFIIAIISVGILSFVFITNQIILSLYYQRKEIGYLELFGLKKKRVFRIISFEYYIKYFLSIIIALSIFLIIVLLIYITLKLNFSIKPLFLIIILIILLTYCYLLVLFPLKKIMKKSIKELIYDEK